MTQDTEINLVNTGQAPSPWTSSELALANEIAEAEEANMHSRPCQVCDALATMSESARGNVERALAGTIGERKLAEILTRNGYPTGRRAVANHRSEGHSST